MANMNTQKQEHIINHFAHCVAQELHINLQKAFILCSKTGLIVKETQPSLHWELTPTGRREMKSDLTPELLTQLQHAQDDLEDGPDLVIQPKHPTKMCANCHQNRGIEHFYHSDKNSDELTKWCRLCLEAFRNTR